MKILFIGCVEFSRHALEAVLKVNGVGVVGVITREKSPINADFFSLRGIAEREGIPFLIVRDNEQDIMERWIQSQEPDVIYCFGWSYLLKRNILESAPLGVVGYHPTALPKNRGRHPIIWALVLGLRETASSFFFMDEGADSGDIISQRKVLIEDYDDAASLYAKLVQVAREQITEFTLALQNGNCKRILQTQADATYWRKRTKKDGIIDWRMSAKCVCDLVRGLTRPYIGASCYYHGNEVKIWKCEMVKTYGKHRNIVPGQVIQKDENGFWVKCGEEAVRVYEHEFVQMPEEGEFL